MDNLLNFTNPKNIFIFIIYLIFWLIITLFFNLLIDAFLETGLTFKKNSECSDGIHIIKWKIGFNQILSLIFRRRCLYCHQKVSKRYLLVTLFGVTISLVTYFKYGITINGLIITILLNLFMMIFVIDKQEFIIPDTINLSIGLLGILSFFLVEIKALDSFFIIGTKDRLYSVLMNIIIILFFSILQRILKKEMIGWGDLKLFLVVGLFMGWQLELMGIFIGSIIGTIFELAFAKKLNRKVLPYGPYLVIGFTFSLLFGLDLLAWYIGLFM